MLPETNQRKADMARLQAMIASGRQVPNEDDKAFIRALMKPGSTRLPAKTQERLRPLVKVWL